MKTYLIAAVVLALGSVAAFGQDPQAEQQQGQQPAAEATAAEGPAANNAEEAGEPDPGEEVICRRERVTGSLTRVNRICMTRNEWNGVTDRTRNAHDQMTRNASGGRECRQDQFGGC